MNKSLAIGNAIALIITIVINYLSNTGVFNYNTMSSVSEKYQNYFTPAGYAFSIWGLIYVSLLTFVAYQLKVVYNKVNNKISINTGAWFIISCISNCLWIVTWLYDYTGASVLLMIILLISLIRIIIKNNMELQRLPVAKKLYTWWPFALYTGWICVALIANIAAFLIKINPDGMALPEETWAIIMIITAGLLNIFVSWNRNMPIFAVTGIWALMAIAVENAGKSNAVYTTALIVSAALLLCTIVQVIKKQKICNVEYQ